MSIQDWRNGKWTKLDWFRFWLHIPVGMICAALCATLPVAGVIASIAFLTYEVIEDWRIHDLSFKDVLGFAWGFIAVSSVIAALGLIF